MLERRLLESSTLSEGVWSLVDGLATPGTVRGQTAAALMNLSMSHHVAIVELFQSRRYASPFALVRPSIEGFLRSQWVLFLASDDLLTKFLSAEYSPNAEKVWTALAQLPQYDDGIFEEVIRPIWGIVSDFVHGGGRTALHHIRDGSIEATFPPDVLMAILGAADAAFLVTATALVDLAQRVDIQGKLQSFFLLKSWRIEP